MYNHLLETSRAAKEQHDKSMKADALARRDKQRTWNTANGVGKTARSKRGHRDIATA